MRKNIETEAVRKELKVMVVPEVKVSQVGEIVQGGGESWTANDDVNDPPEQTNRHLISRLEIHYSHGGRYG